MKQFRFLHGSDLSKEEREDAKCLIYKNLLIACITLMCLADSTLASQTNTLERGTSNVSDILAASEEYDQSIAESLITNAISRRGSEFQYLPVTADAIQRHHLVNVRFFIVFAC